MDPTSPSEQPSAVCVNLWRRMPIRENHRPTVDDARQTLAHGSDGHGAAPRRVADAHRRGRMLARNGISARPDALSCRPQLGGRTRACFLQPRWDDPDLGSRANSGVTRFHLPSYSPEHAQPPSAATPDITRFHASPGRCDRNASIGSIPRDFVRIIDFRVLYAARIAYTH